MLVLKTRQDSTCLDEQRIHERNQPMSAKLPRKALIAISSYQGAIYPEGHQTGLFFTEALHPYEVLTDAGFEVDLASETGTYGIDYNSVQPPFLAGSDKAVYCNPKSPFQIKLNSELK